MNFLQFQINAHVHWFPLESTATNEHRPFLFAKSPIPYLSLLIVRYIHRLEYSLSRSIPGRKASESGLVFYHVAYIINGIEHSYNSIQINRIPPLDLSHDSSIILSPHYYNHQHQLPLN